MLIVITLPANSPHRRFVLRVYVCVPICLVMVARHYVFISTLGFMCTYCFNYVCTLK